MGDDHRWDVSRITVTRVARPAEVQDAAFQAGGEAGKDDPRKQTARHTEDGKFSPAGKQ